MSDNDIVNFTDDPRIPRIDGTTNGYLIDMADVERDGSLYKRQRVEVADPALPAGASKDETAQDVVGLLGKILKELRLMNLHLASMTGEKFTTNDLGD